MADERRGRDLEMPAQADASFLACVTGCLAAAGEDAHAELRALIDLQVERALADPVPLRLLLDAGRSAVPGSEAASTRWVARRYVDVWAAVLSRLHPMAGAAVCRARAHAVLGLIAAGARRAAPGDPALAAAQLRRMAWSAATV